MKHVYIPHDRNGRLHHLVEEMGEVMQALGKAGRFGMSHRHPDDGPMNAEVILRELDDLEHALTAVKSDLRRFVEEHR
jgi:hypothetical protein